MKNIGILGIGAIGSLMTKYLLVNPKNKYLYFNRSEKNEITIDFQGKQEYIKIETNKPQGQQLDWLLVCLKEYHFQKAIPTLKKLINPSTRVAIIQNGINLDYRYRQFTNESKLLETIIDCPVQRIGPDSYKQIRKPKIILPKNQLADEFAKLFNESTINLVKVNEFKEQQWVKLIESSSIGSIQTINKKPCVIFKEKDKLDEFIELVREGIEVAKSEGIEVRKELEKELLIKLKGYPENKGSSMLSDLEAGKELELDAKIGVIVKIAKKNKIHVPASRRIYDKLLKEKT